MRSAGKFLDAMKENYVVQTVIVGGNSMQFASGEGGSSLEALKITSIYPGHFVAFATIGLDDPQNLQRLKDYLRRGCSGIELRYEGSGGLAIDDPTIRPIYELSERLRLPVVFHLDLDEGQDSGFERILVRYPRLKAVCPGLLFSPSVGSGERCHRLMEKSHNIFTDTTSGSTDLLTQALRHISLNSKVYRDMITRYQDRILFGTDTTISISPYSSVEWISKMTRVYRDVLEKDRYTFFEEEEEELAGLHLDARILLKIYKSNPERLLGSSEEPHDGIPPEDGWRVPGQRLRDARERRNQSRVRTMLTESLASSKTVDEAFVLSLNRAVLDGFPEFRNTAGVYRNRTVVVRRMGNVMYHPPVPQKIPQLMKQLLELASSNDLDIGRVAKVLFTFLKIHPFADGNGRTGRALATYLLLRMRFRERNGRSLESYCDSNIVDYYDVLSQSRAGDTLPWLLYFTAATEYTMHPPVSAAPKSRRWFASFINRS